ncbi:unnamed protein product, partial [Phaeothamnion confervicola]
TTGRSGRAEAEEEVRKLKGFGPFSIANVMQLTGRFDSFPFDSETLRHFREVHKVRKGVKEIDRRARAHYARYAPFQ